MADYSKKKCPSPRCGNSTNNQGIHCMGCSSHPGTPAMHMWCSGCEHKWIVPLKRKEKKP